MTGFSGTQPPITIAPGVDPADKTYIDLAGPSMRVIDLDVMGGPPQAQLVQATKPYTATAAQIGQVFGVALDNASPPNIYVAASSAYGLPIVVPDMDGDGVPDRVKQGAPNASFMPGLFGPQDQGGGPGSIWRIDGATGEVRLFANVTLDGAPNSGPALGGLAFDPGSNTLFVADRDTGMIHRFDMNGAELGHYDHGVQGRTAAGLPPVPFDPANRLDITKPQFQVTNPATWAYPPPPRRIFGLGVRNSRLYYAVAENLQIWSVSIAGGAFGTDAHLEITVPPNVGPTEISKITFDDRGRMLLAERAAPTGAYDFVVLAQEGIGRVLRYTLVTPPAAGASGWQQVPDQYAIGFPLQMRNGNGGVAVGYRYDEQGRIDRATCDGFLWSTGEELRVTADAALAAQLAAGGPAIVNGLQGNDIELVVPANVPPLKTYFIDYDDKFDDPAARGHLGDIAIWRLCGRAAGVGGRWLPGLGFLPFGVPGVPVAPPPPPPYCPVPSGWCVCPPGDATCVCPPGTQLQPGIQCCPGGQMPGPGGCQSLCANPADDPALCWMGVNPSTGLCWNNTPVGPGPFCPIPPGAQCPTGYTMTPGVAGWWTDATCVPAPALPMCAAGEEPGLDNQCHADVCPAGSIPFTVQQCCPVGTVANAFGQCTACPAGQMTANGICCPAGQQPGGPGNLQCVCPPVGLPPDPVTGACPVVLPLMGPAPPLCPDGKMMDPSGKCPLPPPPPPPPPPLDPNACAPAYTKLPSGQCCLRSQITTAGVCCPFGQMPDPATNRRTCVSITPPGPSCLRGFTLLPSGCCPTSQVAGSRCCPIGTMPDANRRTCVSVTQEQPKCTSGYTLLGNQCCLNSQVAGNQCCSRGFTPDARRQACVPISGVTPVPVLPVTPTIPVTPTTPCGPGSVLLRTGCCPRGQVNSAGVCCQPGTRPEGRACVAITAPPPLCPGGVLPDRLGRCPQPCQPGYHRVAGQCVPIVIERKCGPLERWDGSKCVTTVIERRCPEGQHLVGTRCVPIIIERPCPAGQQRIGTRCVTIERPCPQGTHRVGTRCVPTRIEQPCPAGQTRVRGVCVPIRRELRPSTQTPQQPTQQQLKRFQLQRQQ